MPRIRFIRESFICQSEDSVEDLNLIAISSRAHAFAHFDLKMSRELGLVPIQIGLHAERIEVVSMDDY